MWAKLENNEIRVYTTLPENLKNYIGFNQMDSEVHRSEGFYPFVPPVLTATQKTGELYFDKVNEEYTHRVVEKTQEEIDIENTPEPPSLQDQIVELREVNLALIELLNEKGILS